MIERSKSRLTILKLFFIFIFSLPIFVFAQNNNCLNFTGGVGEFEIIDKREARKVPLGNHISIPAGWSLSRNEGILFKTEIDRKNYVNNNISKGSLKININKPQNIYTNWAGTLSINLYTDYPYVSNETKNYYPKIGDTIEGRLKVKLNPNYNNFYLRIIFTASTTNTSSIKILDRTFYNFSEEWQEIIVTSSMPTNIGNLLRLTNRIELGFNHNNQPANIEIWLDDFRLFAYRNNNCLTIPEKPYSSLKMFEINHYYPCDNCSRNYDFIKLYLQNDAWWGIEDYPRLIAQYLNPNFKSLPYFLATVMRRGNNVNNKYCRSTHDSVINQYFDRLCIANINTSIKRIHPNALYPDLIERSLSLNNHTSWTWDQRDLRIDLNNKSGELISKNFLKYYKKFYGDSFFQPYSFAYDLLEVDGYRDPVYTRQVTQPLFLKIFKHSMSPYIKYIGNLGYYIYANPDEINSGKNWYTQFKFTNGYFNEKFIAANDIQPSVWHKQFKSLIENKGYDIIMSVSWYNQCNNNDSWLNFIVSAFYLVNQQNAYFALAPGTSYSTPQCYPESLYLSIGEPLPIENINQLVLASTSNFTNGGLYKRNYTNGLVLLNTSPSNSYSYQLSNNSEPINFLLYRDQFGRIYDVSQNATTINLGPLTGLILYSSGQNLEVRP